MNVWSLIISFESVYFDGDDSLFVIKFIWVFSEDKKVAWNWLLSSSYSVSSSSFESTVSFTDSSTLEISVLIHSSLVRFDGTMEASDLVFVLWRSRNGS